MSQARKALAPLLPIISLSILGVLAATVISINSGQGVEFGQGVRETDVCSSQPRIEFDSNFHTDDELYVTEVRLTNIPTVCSGRQFELRLLDANDTVLETIFWEITQIDAADTSIEARADGTLTQTSNTSPALVSIIYPSTALNDPDPGLALNTVNVENLDGFSLISR